MPFGAHSKGLIWKYSPLVGFKLNSSGSTSIINKSLMGDPCEIFSLGHYRMAIIFSSTIRPTIAPSCVIIIYEFYLTKVKCISYNYIQFYQKLSKKFNNVNTIDHRKKSINLLNSSTPFDFDPLQMVFNVWLYGYR